MALTEPEPQGTPDPSTPRPPRPSPCLQRVARTRGARPEGDRTKGVSEGSLETPHGLSGRDEGSLSAGGGASAAPDPASPRHALGYPGNAAGGPAEVPPGASPQSSLSSS